MFFVDSFRCTKIVGGNKDSSVFMTDGTVPMYSVCAAVGSLSEIKHNAFAQMGTE